MKCKYCGTKNERNATYCSQCGKKLEVVKKSKSKIIIISTITVIAIIIAVIFINKQLDTKQINDLLVQGDRYIEEKDYKKAEDTYLEIIEIDDKIVEPYLKLADVYTYQNDYDKAKEILEQGEEKVSDEDKDKLNDRHDEIDHYIDFSWVVEPDIDADDIYYLRSSSVENYLNTTKKQMLKNYAVIKKDDRYGLIDDDGNVLDDIDCIEVLANFNDIYIVETDDNYYDNNFNNSNFFEVDRSVTAIPFYEYLPSLSEIYYYNDELIPIKNYGLDSGLTIESDLPYPVQQVNELPEGDISAWQLEQDGKYAIFVNDKQLTDFIYEDAGSFCDGLIAVKKDGKWGYLNAEGKEVIPIEYDASWNQFEVYPRETINNFSDFAYSASEGFVTLLKDDKWQLNDTDGNIVIPAGIFDKILPVYNGKCWVEQDGKWGIIKVGEETNQEQERSPQDLSLDEICQLVINHYVKTTNSNDYVIFENECVKENNTYQLVVRYTGGNTANVMYSTVTVDLETGQVEDSVGDSWYLFE